MTIQARVAGFLVFHENHDFCDGCLAVQVGTTPGEVKAAVAALRSRNAVFLRDRWTCELCARRADVTRALAGPTVATKTAIRRRASRIA
jgi:hypothetical protein